MRFYSLMALVCCLLLSVIFPGPFASAHDMPIQPLGVLDAGQAIYRHVETETFAYRALSPQANWIAVNENIKQIKYVSGITLASLTLNISNATSYQFISNPSLDLRPYIMAGYKFVLTDTAGKTLSWTATGTVGTGETRSDEQLTGWTKNMAADWLWETFVTSGTDITTMTNTSVAGHAYCDLGASAPGSLYVYSGTYTKTTGLIYLSVNNDPTIDGGIRQGLSGNYPMVTGTFTDKYVTLPPTVRYYEVFAEYSAGGEASGALAGNTVKQVLTPSAYGGWFGSPTVESGFNYSSASFTIQITRD